MAHNGSGWRIVDMHKKRGRETGRQWRVEIWQPELSKYKIHSKDGTYNTVEAWAKTQAAAERVEPSSTVTADFKDIAAEYVTSIKADVKDTHWKEIDRVAKELVADGATDMDAPGFAKLVREYLAKPSRRTKDGGPLSQWSRRRYLLHFRAIVRFAILERRMKYDPLLGTKLPRIPVTEKPCLWVSELRDLVAFPTPPMRDVFWLPTVLSVYTGCRTEEALHLRWEWIDWEANRIYVRRHPDYDLKGGKERNFPLQPELRVILDLFKRDIGWIVEDDEIRDSDPKTTWKRFRKFLTSRGITPGKRSPKSTRHSFAAIMLATGEEPFTVKRWMGHETLQTTEGYASASEAMQGAVQGWTRGRFHLSKSIVTAA